MTTTTTTIGTTFEQFLASPDILLKTWIDKNTIQLISVLGFGAYGIVYQGRHAKTGKIYAVKLLSQKKERFSEIELHRRLSNHRSILTFDKVVQHGDWTFLVLEYAPEGDLFSAITQPASPIVGNNDAIRHIFLQIVDAVQYCHRHGIAHRDLKPENILMFPNWQVKLADFGLATTQTVSADFGCGSVFYFSPESQGGFIRNNTRMKGYGTQQNDVWSLGVILINLAAGRNPWKQATVNDPAFAAYVRKPSQFFKGILPCISTELNSILERIFCLDPALRISLPELRLRILQCKSFTSRYAPSLHHQQYPPTRRSFNINNTLKQQQQHEERQRPASAVVVSHKNKGRVHNHYRRPRFDDKQMDFQSSNDSHSTDMEYTSSTAMTILQYIQGYVDEDRDVNTALGKKKVPPTLNTTCGNNNNKKKSPGLYVQPPSTKTPSVVVSPRPPTPSCSSSSSSSTSSTASECPSTPRIFNTTTTVLNEDEHNTTTKQTKQYSHQNTSFYYQQWSMEQQQQ